MLLEHVRKMEMIHIGTMSDCDRKGCNSIQANYRRTIYAQGESLPYTATLCKEHATEDIHIARDSRQFKVTGLSDGVRFVRKESPA